MLAGVPAAGGRATMRATRHGRGRQALPRYGRGRQSRPTPSPPRSSGGAQDLYNLHPKPLEFRLRSFFGMDANGNQRVQTVQDLGFLLSRPAPSRYRPRRDWHLGLRPGMSVATCRHTRWGVLGVLNMFGGVILGGMFLGYVSWRHFDPGGVCRVI